jgi:hypothetical protein
MTLSHDFTISCWNKPYHSLDIKLHLPVKDYLHHLFSLSLLWFLLGYIYIFVNEFEPSRATQVLGSTRNCPCNDPELNPEPLYLPTKLSSSRGFQARLELKTGSFICLLKQAKIELPKLGSIQLVYSPILPHANC